MLSALMWLRDVLVGLALGWIGVSLAPREEPAPACPVVKGADDGGAGVCRAPGVQLSSSDDCRR